MVFAVGLSGSGAVECSNHTLERNPAIARHDELFRLSPICSPIDSHRGPPVFCAKLAGEEPFTVDEPCLLGAICLEHEAEHSRLLVIIEDDERALLPRLKRRVAKRHRLNALWQNTADRPQCFERLALSAWANFTHGFGRSHRMRPYLGAHS